MNKTGILPSSHEDADVSYETKEKGKRENQPNAGRDHCKLKENMAKHLHTNNKNYTTKTSVPEPQRPVRTNTAIFSLSLGNITDGTHSNN